MRVTGIVAEFNPLHNGHRHILEKARTLTEADCVIAVMSGDFTQRGTPALCDKHLRAEMALKNGADIVIELPVRASTSSAEFFAGSAVFLLDASGVVTDMIFGIESGDTISLSRISETLLSEPDSYKRSLKDELKKGHSFPTARQSALIAAIPEMHDLPLLMSTSNNILAIEYLKALKKLGSSITPHSVQRLGAQYHDNLLHNAYSSALGIRTAIQENNNISSIKSQLPESVYEILEKNFGKVFPVTTSDLSAMLKYRLINAIYDGDDLCRFADVSKSISDRIEKRAISFTDPDDLISSVKTRDMTHSRISRALLHILLGIKSPEKALDASDSYIRILGFKQEASAVLKKMQKNASVPVISRASDAKDVLQGASLETFNDTLRAGDIYNKIIEEKYGTVSPGDLKRKAEIKDGLVLC
ncbi:MAG: nucleotidyltransferase [Lachnospiraceae bacterium]|nr:nucleotidyltransferase [Lachnospiraceae bacterium]